MFGRAIRLRTSSNPLAPPKYGSGTLENSANFVSRRYCVISFTCMHGSLLRTA